MKQEILEISDDITSATVDVLLRRVKRILDEGVADLELSLENVEIIDSTGIGFIIRLQNSLAEVNGGLVLSKVNDDIFKMMKFMRLDKHFTIKQ